VDGVGDALACAPLLAALRAAGHNVSGLLTTRNARIFARDAFERVHIVERIPWPKHGYVRATWEAALDQARSARYEIALIASEEPQAYAFARRARIPVRVGFHNGMQKPFKSWWVRRQCTRALYRSASLVRAGQPEPTTLFALGDGLHSEVQPTHDVARLRPLVVGEDSRGSDGPLLQLGSKWTRRGRSPEAVAQWVGDVVARDGWRIVADEAERLEVESVARSGNFRVEYFSDQQAWKNAVATAAVVLAADSGAAHVAGMTGVPVVDVFERDRFEAHVARWRPWAAPSRVLAFPSNAGRDFGQQLADCARSLLRAGGAS